MSMARIKYRGFWDRPLAFVVEHQGVQLLFWREFNEEADEYEDDYRVFVLPHVAEQDLAMPNSWENLPNLSSGYLGSVPVKDVQFDVTYRKAINTKLIDDLLDNTRS